MNMKQSPVSEAFLDYTDAVEEFRHVAHMLGNFDEGSPEQIYFIERRIDRAIAQLNTAARRLTRARRD